MYQQHTQERREGALLFVLGFGTDHMTEGEREMPLQRAGAIGLTGIDMRSRLGFQVSSKDRSLSRPPNRPELCMHTIPIVILLCFFILWAGSSEVKTLPPQVRKVSGLDTLVANSENLALVQSPPGTMSSMVLNKTVQSSKIFHHRHFLQQ
ncbi:unnamed protein product [Sphagnum troendelagicum]